MKHLPTSYYSNWCMFSTKDPIRWNKQQHVKMGRLLKTSRVPQKSCGKPIYVYYISSFTHLEVTYCILRTCFPPLLLWICRHTKCFYYLYDVWYWTFSAYFFQRLKPSLKDECGYTCRCASYLAYPIPCAFRNKLTICILSNFRC